MNILTVNFALSTGLGIMIAIDFNMTIDKQPDPRGDRVGDHDERQVPGVQEMVRRFTFFS